MRLGEGSKRHRKAQRAEGRHGLSLSLAVIVLPRLWQDSELTDGTLSRTLSLLGAQGLTASLGLWQGSGIGIRACVATVLRNCDFLSAASALVPIMWLC